MTTSSSATMMVWEASEKGSWRRTCMVSEEVPSPQTRRRKGRCVRRPAAVAGAHKRPRGGRRTPLSSVGQPDEPAQVPPARPPAAVLGTVRCSYRSPFLHRTAFRLESKVVASALGTLGGPTAFLLTGRATPFYQS